MEWILYANAAVWLGIGGYVFFLMRCQQRVQTRLRRLERNHGQA